MKIAVVIPIYSDELAHDYKAVIEKNIQLLSRCSVYIIGPERLAYVANNFGVLYEQFDESYFNGIKGYNRLMLTSEIYERFKLFDWLVVCQHDVLLFKKNIADYLMKENEINYLGAPWFHGFSYVKRGVIVSFGNGGLSARRIATFREHLSKKDMSLSAAALYDLYIRHGFGGPILSRLIRLVFKVFSYRNNLRFYQSGAFQEDIFWSYKLNLAHFKNRENLNKAMLFSWDSHPDLCYLMSGQRPLGLHAYEKVDKEFLLEILSND